MADYSDAIREHTKMAAQLYKTRLPEIEKLAGFSIFPDGSNTASKAEDVKRYLLAIQTVGGAVSFTSAKMVVTNAIHRLGLAPVPV
ncbi:MAG: hypothetical protein AB1411_14825 [Nitrospirota bacterium]